MAKENLNDKQKKPNFLKKVAGFFKALGLRIGSAFKDMAAELKKVTWPSKPELINYSVVVLIFMAFMGIVIGLFDAGAAALVSLIVGA